MSDRDQRGPEGPEGLAGHHEIRNSQQLRVVGATIQERAGRTESSSRGRGGGWGKEVATTGHVPHSSLDLLTKPEKPIGHLEEHVKEQEERIGKAVQAAREALEKQREVMKKGRPENARQSFAPGDSIFIKDFPSGLAKKLQPRQRGPFTILEKKNNQVYVLQRRGVREPHTFNTV